ncbi:MAG TPA: hypothetical protein VF339_18675, partial [Gammaproteobacteria bacterium]
MSTREIAKVLGVNNATVARDLSVANATDEDAEALADLEDSPDAVANATDDDVLADDDPEPPPNPVAAKRKAAPHHPVCSFVPGTENKGVSIRVCFSPAGIAGPLRRPSRRVLVPDMARRRMGRQE